MAILLLRKGIHAFLFCVMLFAVFALTITPIPVKAGTYDGTYDYEYKMRAPGGSWQTYRVSSGFIVSNGRISSDPSWLSGTVDSSGNVRFEGSSPYGQEHGTAVYTGKIKSDGTGNGDYQDSTGLVGSWSVTRVSGGGGGGGSFDLPRILLTIMSIFSPIGEFFGFSGSTASAIGVAAVVVPIIFIGSWASTGANIRKQKAEASKIKDWSLKRPPQIRYSRERGYKASQPAPTSPSMPQGGPPPIDSSAAQSIGGVGLQRDSSLPSALNLRSDWAENQVTLNWDAPIFDTSKYQLEGYVISEMKYGPTSTTVQQNPIRQLSTEIRQDTIPFQQTYWWNTSGDLDGFKVEALLCEITGPTKGTIRIPDRVYVPP